jgi:hypothetical protein
VINSLTKLIRLANAAGFCQPCQEITHFGFVSNLVPRMVNLWKFTCYHQKRTSLTRNITADGRQRNLS